MMAAGVLAMSRKPNIGVDLSDLPKAMVGCTRHDGIMMLPIADEIVVHSRIKQNESGKFRRPR